MHMLRTCLELATNMPDCDDVTVSCLFETKLTKRRKAENPNGADQRDPIGLFGPNLMTFENEAMQSRSKPEWK